MNGLDSEGVSHDDLALIRAKAGRFVASRRRIYGDPRSLYGRAGGVYGLAKLSYRLVDACLQCAVQHANENLSRNWNCGFQFLMTQLMGYLLRGPQQYMGNSLVDPHRCLLTDRWESCMPSIDNVLAEMKFDTETQRQLRDVLIGLHTNAMLDLDNGALNLEKETHLFDELGGLYAIADFVDRLVERLLATGQSVLDSRHLEDLSNTDRRPGLKYMAIGLMCQATGCVEAATYKGFLDEAKLGVRGETWPAFCDVAANIAAEVWTSGDLCAQLMTSISHVRLDLCVGDFVEASPVQMQMPSTLQELDPLQVKLETLLQEDAELSCPITLTLFVDPVMGSDGFIYERVSVDSLLHSGMVSPISNKALRQDYYESVEMKTKSSEFRSVRAGELLEFSHVAMASKPQLARDALERVGSYVQVLKPEKVPLLVKQAAESWEKMGKAVPPQVKGRVYKRKLLRSNNDGQGREGAETLARESTRQATGFKRNLDMLLSDTEGLVVVAQRLYTKFDGSVRRLPEICKFMGEKWSFPGSHFPLLLRHLQRVIFEARGEQVHFPKLELDGEIRFGTCAFEVIIRQEEWKEAFQRWLQALRAKVSQAKVARKVGVMEQKSENANDLHQVYFQGPKLGEGAFGEVYVMMHKRLGRERAVKVIHKDQANVASDSLGAEVNVLKALDHLHIIRIYETFDFANAMHIVMDFAQGGDLAGVLKNASNRDKLLEESWVCVAIRQSVAALEYIHSKGVVHCDLKPANAMLAKETDPWKGELPHVLLADFGLAEIFTSRDTSQGNHVKGSPVYLSPEGFEGQVDQKSDMWALGIMCYELLLGKRPFNAGSIFQMWHKVAKTHPPLQELPETAREMVRNLLSKDPQSRMTAKECREHSWFKVDDMPPPNVIRTATHTIDSIGHSNAFHRIIMFCMATKLSMADMEDVQEIFRAIDTDGCGRLTKDSLAEGLRKLGIQEDPEALFALLDMDQNGFLSYTEFLAGAMRSNDDNAERLLEETFQMFDMDGDGTVSSHELRLMLSGDGPLVDVLPDGQTIEQIMAAIGNENGVITFAGIRDFLGYNERSVSHNNQHEVAVGDGIRSAQSAMDLIVGLDTGGPSTIQDQIVSETGFQLRQSSNDTPSLQTWLLEELNTSRDKLLDHSQRHEAISRLLGLCCAVLSARRDAAEFCSEFAIAICHARKLAESEHQDDEALVRIVRSCLDTVLAQS